ncbi:MAG: universal stress protein, partial [Actinomycetota bacterium]
YGDPHELQEDSPMATTTNDHAPRLFDGEQVAEILVPIRAGRTAERGVALAGRYAERWQVPVRLLHVRTADDPSLGVDTARLNLAFTHEDIEVVGVECEADDIPAGVAAEADDRSLLFLATDHGSQWEETGSVGEAVLQQSQMLVLCGRHCEEPPVGHSIVVPLDGSSRAEAALEPALALATERGTRVWLVTAVPEATVATVARLRAQGEDVSESGYLRAVADALAAEGHDVGWEVVHNDDPVAGVLSFAEAEGSSMIVAATHGDTGVAKRLFGSICLGLVERGPVPVLVVRTDGHDAPPLLAAD